VRLALAAIHLLALALGVFALSARARALAAAQRNDELKSVFFWDGAYGAVGIVWLGSGVWRAFSDLEKGTDYYLSNHAFWTKMLLLAVFFVIETTLAVTFVRWRALVKRNEAVSLAAKARLVRFHHAELGLLLGMVVMATLMARGVGVVNAKPGAGADNDASGIELEAGERVYKRYCVTCHQVDGRGLDGKLAADFRAPGRLDKPDAALETSVAGGIPGTAMAAFRGELDDREIRSVVAYVKQTYGANGRP
jgi:putative membrane protein